MFARAERVTSRHGRVHCIRATNILSKVIPTSNFAWSLRSFFDSIGFCFPLKLLIKLSQNSFTTDELVENDTLKLLFTIITSICDEHNIGWRRAAFDALVTLSKRFTINAINYIHFNDCIQKTLESIDDQSALGVKEKIDVLITLILLIKDSAVSSQVLIDDFRSTGYRIISDLVLGYVKRTTYGRPSSQTSEFYFF